MAVTRDQAYAALVSLNPAQVFLDSYRVRPLPEGLDIYFGPPEEFFIAPDTQERYSHNRLIPILDDGNFDLVTFLDPSTGQLVQIRVESPDEVRSNFQHWQQFVADMMIRIGESVDDDERIRRMAAMVGFAHLDELFAYFARAQDLNGAAWCETRRQFLLSIRP